MTDTTTLANVSTASGLPAGLLALAPFSNDIEVAPGVGPTPDIRRVRNLTDRLSPALLRMCGGSFHGRRVLDLACNCGGFSFLAHRHGAAEVVGIDTRSHHIEQAEQITGLLETGPSVRFQTGRIEQADPAHLGTFDVVFLLGILYHLEGPDRSDAAGRAARRANSGDRQPRALRRRRRRGRLRPLVDAARPGCRSTRRPS